MPVKQSFLRSKDLKKKVTSNKQSLRANALKRQVTSEQSSRLRAKKQKSVIANEVKQSSQGTKSTKIATSANRRTRNDRMSIPVYSLTGRSAGKLSLPKEVFGVPVNEKLLAQALRVYMTNQKNLFASTKQRGEVEGSSAKIYRQKGTGRARHGSIRAPIFVGGGVVFGPKFRKVRLDLPKKMKKVALLSALSDKMGNQGILGLSGIEKATGKTKEMAELMYKVSSIEYKGKEKKSKKINSVLIVTGEKQDNVVRAVRNIPGINVLPANLINAYEVLKHDMLLLTKEAVERLKK